MSKSISADEYEKWGKFIGEESSLDDDMTIAEAIETLEEIKVCSEYILEDPETKWRNVEGKIRKDIEAMRMAIDCLMIVGVCREEYERN